MSVAGGVDKTWVTGRDGGQHQAVPAVAEEIHIQCGVGDGELRPGEDEMRWVVPARLGERVGFGEDCNSTADSRAELRGGERRGRDGGEAGRAGCMHNNGWMDGIGAAGLQEAADREGRLPGWWTGCGWTDDNRQQARGIGFHFRDPASLSLSVTNHCKQPWTGPSLCPRPNREKNLQGTAVGLSKEGQGDPSHRGVCHIRPIRGHSVQHPLSERPAACLPVRLGHPQSLLPARALFPAAPHAKPNAWA